MRLSLLSQAELRREARPVRLGTIVVAACFLVLPGDRSPAADPPAPAAGEWTVRLPVLTVNDRNEGDCLRVRFLFSRSTAAVPLSLAVVEDTPAGAGESIRASVWSAAMVAALERMDPLSGVRVSLELSGTVDGPSAGAAIGLAILSALDGRPFPDDCAVTGAIMPDGTIGGVGGLAVKLRAAAASGIRRVLIPTYSRFEKQPGTGEDVDLKRLAAKLHLEVIPVDNISEAYAVLHGLTPQRPHFTERAVLELPEATEEVLKRRYQEHRQAALTLWNALPQEDRKSIAEEPLLEALLVDPQIEAEKAYRAGRLALAAERARTWHAALLGHKSLCEDLASDFQQIVAADAAGVDARLKKRLTSLAGGFLDLNARLADQPVVSEASAQLWAGGLEQVGVVGVNDVFQSEIDRLTREAQKPGMDAEAISNLQREAHLRRFDQLVVAHILVEEARLWPLDQAALATTLPVRSAGEQADEVERLFLNAHLAIRNTFRHDVVESVAGRWQLSAADVTEVLRTVDSLLVMQEPAVGAARIVHERSVGMKKSAGRRFRLAVSAHLQAEALTQQSGLVVRWAQLDADVGEDGSFLYGRTDLLNYLINAARENALRVLAQCREKNLVALWPIMRFESAEMSRDDVETDKVEVLIDYWSASLQAKTLLMLCGTTENMAMSGRSDPSPADPRRDQTAALPTNNHPMRSGPSPKIEGRTPSQRPMSALSRFNQPTLRPFPLSRNHAQRPSAVPMSAEEEAAWRFVVVLSAFLVGLLWMVGKLGQRLTKKTEAKSADQAKNAIARPHRTLLQEVGFACGTAVRRLMQMLR